MQNIFVLHIAKKLLCVSNTKSAFVTPACPASLYKNSRSKKIVFSIFYFCARHNSILIGWLLKCCQVKEAITQHFVTSEFNCFVSLFSYFII